MMLAVTLRTPIESAFGTDGYTQIRHAIDDYIQAQGGVTQALDDSADTERIGIQPVLAANASSVLLTVRSAVKAIGGIDSLLILGDGGVVPFFNLRNPVTDRGVDQDDAIPSDNPYGTSADTLAQCLAPPLSMGRIPFPVTGRVKDAQAYFDAASAYRSSRSMRASSMVITNADWSSFSQTAAAELPEPVDFHLSPGYQLRTVSDIQREFVYVNLHGLPGDPVWKGFDAVQGKFIPVVSPDTLQGQQLPGTLVFAENCYGAQISGRTPANSCALSLAQQGAAFIGASGLSFGSYIAPRMFLQDADALAASFFAECKRGATIGSALSRARADFLSSAATPPSDPYKQKTLLQFLLLGDPTWN